LYAQDSLPNFTVESKGNGRAIISWINTLKNVNQISVQRSTDSLRNFKSIMTVADPELPQNGFADTKASGIVFYRLFIVQDGGAYVFSKSKRLPNGQNLASYASTGDSKQVQIAPMSESKANEIAKTLSSQPDVQPAATPVAPVKPERMIMIIRNDSIINKVGERSLKKFRDSIVTRTKDTILFITADTIVIKSFVPKEVYKSSKYVYIDKDGNVAVSLPDARLKEYHVKFFEDNNDPLFEIKQVKDTYLLLEKANFLHSGWFRFELFEDGKIERKAETFYS
jgi:hypothetical protein